MSKARFSVKEAKEIELVAYLEALGFLPKKVRGNDYWYLSPLRQEKTASFKVDRRLNVWYDHGMGKGGNLIDFGILFYGCSVRELLQKLETRTGPNLSFHPPICSPQNTPKEEEKKLIIGDVKPLTSRHVIGN